MIWQSRFDGGGSGVVGGVSNVTGGWEVGVGAGVDGSVVASSASTSSMLSSTSEGHAPRIQPLWIAAARGSESSV